jgi:hypothetical protein
MARKPESRLVEIGPENCEYCGKAIKHKGRTRGWTHCSHECRTAAKTIYFRCPCGKWFPRYVNNGGIGVQIYCCREHAYLYRRTPHQYKRAERRYMAEGYVKVRHPETGESILEHRLVMEQQLGRRLCIDEHVHHKDHDPANNRADNLVILDPTEHWRVHHGWTLEQVLAERVLT